MEVFGPGGPDPSYQFCNNQVISGFIVNDLEEAISNARGLGLKVLGDGGKDNKGYKWQHFEMPDGTIGEFTSE